MVSIVRIKTGQNYVRPSRLLHRLCGYIRYNSSLILHYCHIAPHLLRPLIHALKVWAFAQDLNDAAGSRGPATMSSYCLTLMAISYLQYCGCLPNLQANVRVAIPDFPDDVSDPDVIWVGYGRDQGVKAHVGFSKSAPSGWTSRDPHLTAGGAIRGFFRYFSRSYGPSENQFDYSSSILSVLNGGTLPRAHVAGYAKRAELSALGYTNEEIGQVMNGRQPQVDQEENMGKGDQGIQPRNWEDRKIVVQDPFLWRKVSHELLTAIH